MESQQVRAAVVGVLRPTIDRLTDEVLESVVDAVPPFQEWWGGRLDVRDGVHQGICGFLDLLESERQDERLPRHDVFFAFGRSEVRAGRSVGSVLAAYRAGAQRAWRLMVETGDDAGVEPRALYALADAIFIYIDRLCAATVEGYAYEQSLTAVERVDARRRLVELAVRREAPPSDAELTGAAADAGWRVPASLLVIAFRDERSARVAARLPPDALVARVDGTGWALVGDPDGPGRRGAVLQALGDVRAGVGPVVAPSAAAASARLAERALDLADDGPVRSEDHRVDLLLLGDADVARRLVADVLDGPLSVAPEAARERLVETLSAWLEHQGEIRPAAEQLHVHTQTVRYRVAQLRELLGDRMSRGEGRLELELALRARALWPAPAER
ncbi:MAG TPA: helix-turn-helix domain-containing protein [Baekduia sp.]|uniref:PucR family transcriptional regulator n=1 Tax=Baekduia sp. TaxID=2600305 RepID=UPI002D78FE52|nr:helix-turn-helix domain-containing protein [Baekduia sp.]HET6508425.1 helix-turn-helix domain-containing protein [Baekduia sp.]